MSKDYRDTLFHRKTLGGKKHMKRMRFPILLQNPRMFQAFPEKRQNETRGKDCRKIRNQNNIYSISPVVENHCHQWWRKTPTCSSITGKTEKVCKRRTWKEGDFFSGEDLTVKKTQEEIVISLFFLFPSLSDTLIFLFLDNMESLFQTRC